MNGRSMRGIEKKEKKDVKGDSSVCHASVSTPALPVPD